ncbi:MAG: class I SAM-dependent methyltransferase [Sphingomonadales bacterium]
MKKALISALRKLGGAMLPGLEPRNLKHELQRMATRETAEYVRRHMRGVPSIGTRRALRDLAIDRCSIEGGLVLEFGVCAGATINHIAARRDWIVDGFDSFEGLPERWRDGYDKGRFATGAPPRVRANVRLHTGMFDRTIPAFLAGPDAGQRPISFLHVDCDLYSSTRTIFDLLGDRVVPGTIILFDEYFNYDGWQDGEFRAFQEFVAARGVAYEYLSYTYKHEQVAVRIL